MTDPVVSKPEAEPAPSREDRIGVVLASYEHGLFHNSPRTPTELAELKDLLGSK